MYAYGEAHNCTQCIEAHTPDVGPRKGKLVVFCPGVWYVQSHGRRFKNFPAYCGTVAVHVQKPTSPNGLPPMQENVVQIKICEIHFSLAWLPLWPWQKMNLGFFVSVKSHRAQKKKREEKDIGFPFLAQPYFRTISPAILMNKKLSYFKGGNSLYY